MTPINRGNAFSSFLFESLITSRSLLGSIHPAVSARQDRVAPNGGEIASLLLDSVLPDGKVPCLVDLLLLVDGELAGAAVDEQQKAADDGKNLEEVVLGEVLVGVVLVELSSLLVCISTEYKRAGTYSPEVVDEEVEDGEDDDQQGGAELGLEANDNHDAGNGADERDKDPAESPGAAEDETHEEEDEENTSGKLEVHLAVLLVKLGNTREGLGLADPRVGEDHDKTANDGEVTEEEVDVEDQAIAESLRNDNGHETADGVVGVLAGNNEDGACGHGDDIDE